MPPHRRDAGVRASNPYGVPANSSTATIDVVSYQPFTDNTLLAGSSVMRAVHITELRTRIDALRVRFGLAPYGWISNPLITPGVTGIKAQHILELRAALSEAYVAAKLTPPGPPRATFPILLSLVENPPTIGPPIRRV